MGVFERIRFEDVIAFWKSFYPEDMNTDEMINNIENIIGKKIDEIKADYYREPNVDQIYKYFKTNYGCIQNNELELYYEKCQWFGFYYPIFSIYYESLKNTVFSSNIVENKNGFIQDIIIQICSKCNDLAYRTLIVETNIAKNEKLLQGKTHQEKGNYFSKVLLKNDEYLKNIYAIYPELIRSLDTLIKYRINFVNDVIKNTEKDLKKINKIFGAPGPILQILMGKGDSHNRGKMVCKVIFKNKVLIYKPRRLEMEKVYYDLLKWLNHNNIPYFIDLKACRSISFDDHGWMEYIEFKECENTEQVKKFYMRVGELLCLLYVLNGKDMHYENIIANVEYPMIIDLETLLHTEIVVSHNMEKLLSTRMSQEINNSVNSVAILPTYIIGKDRMDAIDIGGVGFTKPQKTPFKNLVIKNYGTDEVRLEYDYGMIYPGYNNPSVKGEDIDIKKFDYEIQFGFFVLYKWIMEHKEVFIDKVVDVAADKMVRNVLKPTNVYSRILNISYHPDLLHNSYDRLAFLCLVRYQQKTVTEKDIFTLQEEVQNLYDGDIPFFNMLTNDVKILSKNSYKEDYFETTILDQVKKKIQNLSEEDMNRQLAFIESSYRYNDRKKNITPTVFQFGKRIEKEEEVYKYFIDYAKRIGDLVSQKGIYGIVSNNKKAVSWLGVNTINSEADMMGPVGNDLYDGNAGIALFFLYLYKVTQKTEWKNMIYYAINPIMETLDNFDEYKNEFNIGAFIGGYGWIYALTKIALELNNSTLLNYVRDTEKWLTNYLIKNKCNSDVIGGYAGILGVVVYLYEHNIINEQNFYERVDFLVKHIKCAMKKDIASQGYYWDEGYSSFAHGNAGICAQLSKILKYKNSDEISSIIRKALKFERSLYDKKSGTWLRRKGSSEIQYTWCNGALGVLLSRLELKKNGYKDETMNKEISHLIKMCKENSMGRDMCSCHGDIGNLVILKYAANFTKDRTLEQECISTGCYFIKHTLDFERFEREELWGIMTGVSGIGLGLISLVDDNYLKDLMAIN